MAINEERFAPIYDRIARLRSIWESPIDIAAVDCGAPSIELRSTSILRRSQNAGKRKEKMWRARPRLAEEEHLKPGRGYRERRRRLHTGDSSILKL